MQPENNKKANKLCILSLLCVFLPILLSVSLSPILNVLFETSDAETSNTLWDITWNILGIVGLLLLIAGIGLMIYVRVKYPKNTFGKVIMWLYIVLAIFSIIALIITMVICYSAMATCGGAIPEICEECRQIDS